MKRLAELRKKAGLSQAELGKVVNAAQNSISNWENGTRQPSNDDLVALAKYFGVSVDYLLGGSDGKNSDSDSDFNINTLEYALYGEAKDLDEDEKRQLLELARLMRKKRKR